MRIFHTGDLHLGSFNGPNINGQNARFLDILNHFEILKREVRTQKPDLIVIAGDLFHQAKVWSSRGLQEQSAMISLIRDLKQTAPVAILRGTPNHDAKEQFEALQNIFQNDPDVIIAIEPKTVTLDFADGPVNLSMIPSFSPEWYTPPSTGLDISEINKQKTEDLNNLIRTMSQKPDPVVRSVLVSHYTAAGARLENGQQAFFSNFEAVIDPAVLDLYDLCLLGHIHRPQKIENTKSAYYCGGLMAFNFNDEFQPRGYWMHDLDAAGAAESEFTEIPCREFLSVRIDQKQMTEFLDQGSIPHDVENKIIRVFYEILPEDKSRFNEASLQDYLYKKGAFFVSSIQENGDASSTSLTDLQNDDPLDLIASDLENRTLSDIQKHKLIEMARPVFEEVFQNQNRNHTKGAFSLQKIHVHNYRSYKDETFDFSPVSFCAVHGENGTGKSSLFMDAMLDGFFESPREGDLCGWISMDPDVKSGLIEIEFSIGDEYYRLERSRTKSRKASLRLYHLEGKDFADISEDRISQTQAKIETLLGMDQQLFLSCTLIMQDQYGIFLEAPSSERLRILSDIFGLHFYQEANERIAGEIRETQRAIKTLDASLETIECSLMSEKETDLRKTDVENRILSLNSEYDHLQKESALLQEKSDQEMQKESLRKSLEMQIHSLAVQNENQIQQIAQFDSRIKDICGQLSLKDILLGKCADEADLLKRKEDLLKETALISEKRKRLHDLQADVETYQRKQNSFSEQIHALDHQKEAIEQLLKQSVEIQSAYDRYNQIQKELNEGFRQADEYRTLFTKLQNAENDLRRFQMEKEQDTRQYEIEKSRLLLDIEKLRNSGCLDSSRASCRFLAEAKQAPVKLQSCEQYHSSKQSELSKQETVLQTSIVQLRTILENHPGSPARLQNLQKSSGEYESAVKNYQALCEAKNTCSQISSQKEWLVKEYSSIEALVNGCRKEIEDIESDNARDPESELKSLNLKLAEIERCRNQLSALPLLQKQKEDYESQKDSVQKLHEETESRLRALKCDLENVKETDHADYKTQMEEIQKECAAVLHQKQDLLVEKGVLEQKMTDFKNLHQKYTELSESKSDNAESLFLLNILKDLTGSKGIPHQIITKRIYEIESVCDDILSSMSQGAMKVRFALSKTMKSSKNREVSVLDINIVDANGLSLPYVSKSGGERVKAALATVLAISEIRSRSAGIQSRFLFIDEPPFLDEFGIQAYCDALEAIKKRNSELKIMAISHDESFKGRFSQSVLVSKTSEGSHAAFI